MGTRAVAKYPGLRDQPGELQNRNPLVQMGRQFLRGQFGRPTGLWGALAGRIMAGRRSNRERIEWTLSLLDIKPGDRVLEVGFGPGIALERISRFTDAGFIAGIDHSDVMVRQASRRNANVIRLGRMVLRQGSAADAPGFGGRFDKIFTINSIHFWTNPVQCLRHLRTLLRPNGLIAVTVQPRSRGATDSTAMTIGEEMTSNLQAAGFSNCRSELKRMAPVAAVCVLAKRQRLG